MTSQENQFEPIILQEDSSQTSNSDNTEPEKNVMQLFSSLIIDQLNTQDTRAVLESQRQM